MRILIFLLIAIGLNAQVILRPDRSSLWRVSPVGAGSLTTKVIPGNKLQVDVSYGENATSSKIYLIDEEHKEDSTLFYSGSSSSITATIPSTFKWSPSDSLFLKQYLFDNAGTRSVAAYDTLVDNFFTVWIDTSDTAYSSIDEVVLYRNSDSTLTGADSFYIYKEDFYLGLTEKDSIGLYLPDTNMVDTSYYASRLIIDGEWQDSLSWWKQYPTESSTPVSSGWDETPVNINNSTYLQDVHDIRGHDGLARIDSNLFALTPYHSGGRYEVWKSTDGGATWTSLSYFYATYPPSILSGKDGYIYIFHTYENYLKQIKFLPTATSLPSATNIQAVNDGYSSQYTYVTSTIDSAGRLIVTTNENHTGTIDRIVQVVSSDNGSTWSSKVTIDTPVTGFGLYNAHCAVSTSNIIYCTYGTDQNSPDSENDRKIYFTKSTDHGATYSTRKLMYTGAMVNTHLLAVGDSTVYMFGQNQYDHSPGNGLVFTKSTDAGDNWSSWVLIDTTCYYADPSAALTSDNHIIVAMRRDNGTGSDGTNCGDSCHVGILESDDGGSTWVVKKYLSDYERTGTQVKLRYHTWYNYGGKLEWMWKQFTDGGTVTPSYYDSNPDITIKEQSS